LAILTFTLRDGLILSVYHALQVLYDDDDDDMILCQLESVGHRNFRVLAGLPPLGWDRRGIEDWSGSK